MTRQELVLYLMTEHVHRWSAWLGTVTRFRICELCGACNIDTRRPS